MRARATSGLRALVASVGFAACFDWTALPLDPVVDAGGGDAAEVDGSTTDEGGPAVGDSGPDGDVEAATRIVCPEEPDGSRRECVRGAEACCQSVETAPIDGSVMWTCAATDAGCAVRFECTRSADCPSTTPFCCYSGPSATCKPAGPCTTLCADTAECVALDAGTTCAVSPSATGPPPPLRVCSP